MKKRITLTALLSALALSVLVSGAAAVSNSTSNALDDSGKLPEGISDYIEDQFEKSHIPGMSFEIVSADEILFQGSYGEAKSCDEQYILGSLSKSFTAVAIMQLEERGLLSVDERVSKYLPEFEQSSATTLRQLLTQTSGTKTSDTMEHYKTSDTPAPYTYSNQNYNLLGRIVEEVSGESYGDYIQTHIFDPLEMTSSRVSLSDAENMIAGSRNLFGFYYHTPMPYPENMTSGWMTVSAAYLISTANDMGRYLRWYINGSHPEVLSVEGREKMFSDAVPVEEQYEYGYGWGINLHSGAPVYMHGGNVENYTTYMIIIPNKQIGIICLTNSCDVLVADGYTEKIPENVEQLILGRHTYDIEKGEYWRRHIIDDLIMLLVLSASALPAFLYKRWRKKSHRVIPSAVFITVVHFAVPSLMLTIFYFLLDRPIDVIFRFAPDVFAVICVSAACLYVTGIMKAVRLKMSILAQKIAKADGLCHSIEEKILPWRK